MSRPLLLWGGLVATLLATWYASGIEEDASDEDLLVVQRPVLGTGLVTVPRPSPPKSTQAEAGSVNGPVHRMGELRMGEPRVSIMPAHSWRPPEPPPSAAPVAPAPPQAPPLPFRYLGRLDGGDGGPVVFLSEGNQANARPLVVRSGDRIRDYQIDAITPRGATFTYLPLNQKQQLQFGSAP